jgi:hypothetical protein
VYRGGGYTHATQYVRFAWEGIYIKEEGSKEPRHRRASQDTQCRTHGHSLISHPAPLTRHPTGWPAQRQPPQRQRCVLSRAFCHPSCKTRNFRTPRRLCEDSYQHPAAAAVDMDKALLLCSATRLRGLTQRSGCGTFLSSRGTHMLTCCLLAANGLLLIARCC